MDILSTFYPNLHTTNNLVLRIFGCVAFVHVHNQNMGKFDPRALKCVFVGYSSTHKGYKCYHPPSKRFYVSVDVTLHEQESYFTIPYLQGENLVMEDKDRGDFLFLDLPSLPLSKQSRPADPLTETLPKLLDQPEPVLENPKSASMNVRFDKAFSRKKTIVPESVQVQDLNPNSENEVTISNPSLQFESHVNNDDQDLPITIRKGIRECTNQPLYPLTHFLSFKKISPSHRAFLVSLNTISIPTIGSEALTNEKWKQAMNVEMEALEKNKTWELVKLPAGKKLVGCKWVCTVKYTVDGSIEKYKARLVAKGYTQTYGIDYQETFALIAKMNTVRVLLSLAANYNWNLQQFDVKNAFLHGELEEEIYMEVPPSYDNNLAAHTVCKLKKALYGLKQSPRAWFGRFARVMITMGYRRSQGDHDDIIVTGNDDKERQVLNQCLAKECEIKALGRLKYFLGIEVAHSKQDIFISQQKYVTDLLKETGKTACKPASNPIDPNLRLGEAEKDATVDKEMYQRLVGRLIYLSHTRPNIAYAMSVISQFMHSPKEAHLQAAYRVLQYLKGATGKGILFKRNGGLVLEAYTDADYAGSIVDRRSTSGYCTFLGGNLVTWRSKKQNVVARSSAEAEFRTMAQGVCELLWLKIVLEDLKIKWDGPMRLYCDNKSTINIAHNPVQHDRTKHIEIDRHFIKEKLDSGLICTPYVPTHGQLADILTKGLSGSVFQSFVSKGEYLFTNLRGSVGKHELMAVN